MNYFQFSDFVALPLSLFCPEKKIFFFMGINHTKIFSKTLVNYKPLVNKFFAQDVTRNSFYQSDKFFADLRRVILSETVIYINI